MITEANLKTKKYSSWHSQFAQSVSPVNVGSELHQQWSFKTREPPTQTTRQHSNCEADGSGRATETSQSVWNSLLQEA